MVLLDSTYGSLEWSPQDEAQSSKTYLIFLVSLLTANSKLGDKDALAAFIQRISDVLRDIVENEKLVFKTKDALPKPSSSSENLEPESEEPTGEADAALECSNGELRMKVVISLWLEVKQVFKGAALGYAAERLIECITENEKGLVFDFPVLDDQCIERARRNWLALCLDSALSVPTRQVELLKMFWGFDGSKRQFNLDHIASMWKMSLELWKEVNGPWTGFVVLLAAPFTYVISLSIISPVFNLHFSDSFKWEPSAEDYSLWEETVDHTLALASEHGVDGYVVLDDIAELISACHTSARAPGLAMRLIDMLLAHLGPDIRDVPENLLGLVSETMVATYPPAARHHAVAMWMVRSLTTTIENCPLELLVRFLEAIKEGVCVWLKDRDEHWTDDGLTYDVSFSLHSEAGFANSLFFVNPDRPAISTYSRPRAVSTERCREYSTPFGHLQCSLHFSRESSRHCRCRRFVRGLLESPRSRRRLAA